jgi:flagellar basal-body rod protein FlgB
MSLLDPTQYALESAMGGSMLRQSLLANDLANANTPGFQPQDVDFTSTLAQAIAGGQSPTDVSFTPYTADQVTQANGNGVDSEQTDADIAENGLLYDDLTQVAATREGILKTAINSNTAA